MGEALRNFEWDEPNAAIIDGLTQIWQQVLQRSNIGPEDTFHDLGGNDPLADRIFEKIAQRFGRQLPAATICHAPTIAGLAALLQQPSLRRFSPFVKLRGGIGKTSILITPGVGGRASFSELAKHIHTEHAIYGIQAKGVDGLEEPFDSVEDMANFYLAEFQTLQPEGSCILIGYSFGGLIALEMAQRLSAAGRPVALLAMVDSYPHPRFMALGQRLPLFAKRIQGHLSELSRKPPGVAISEVRSALQRRLHLADVRGSQANASEISRLSFARTTARVKKRDLLAMRRYRPRFYRGKIRFVRPEGNSYLPTDPTAFWKKLATELQVETVPGDHLGMVGTHFKSLAAVLTRYVREALAE